MNNKCGLASAIAVAVSMSNAAYAQTDPGASSSTKGITEIVVTATKRNENLTQVPIAMQVVTSQALAERGITTASDVLKSVPNVTFIEDNAGEAYINIRGQTAVRNSDPNVAIVIDGVTLSSVKAFNKDLFDIQQIEVLKGPQSALYGRNAAAGALVITTKKPTDVFEGDVVVGYGNWNTRRLTGSVSGPLTDTLSFSLAGSSRGTDGPFKNVTTGENVQRNKSQAERLRLLYDNHDGFTLDLKVGGHHTRGGGTAYNAQIAGSGIGGLPANPPVLDANFADMAFTSNVRGDFNERFKEATLKADYENDLATFTSITGYNRVDQYFGGDSPPYIPDTGMPGATVQQYTYLDKNFSQEFRVTSPNDERFRWQVGFYYLKFTRNQTSNIMLDQNGTLPDSPDTLRPSTAIQPSVAYSNPYYETTSYAPYANLEFDLTDTIQLRVAGRYDTEKRSIREKASAAINPLTGISYNNCVALTGRSPDQCYESKTFKQFEPKVSLSYMPTADLNLYVSWGKGFKSGGFNPIGARAALQAAAVNAGLNPNTVYVNDQYSKEVSTSYEIGLKSQLWDHRLSVDFAVFNTDVTGAQQFEFYPTVGLQTTVSINKVRLRGFDSDFRLDLDSGTHVYGGVGYVDGKIKSFDGNPSFVGNVAPGSTKYTINFGLAQDIYLTDGLELTPRVELNRYGPIWWDVANTPGTRRDALSLVDARISLKGDKGWELSVWGNNLTNKKYFQEVVPLLGYFTVNYRGPTRAYGVEARYNF